MDQGLILSFMSFEILENEKHCFELSEISTYDVTKFINPNKKITDLDVEAYIDGKYVDKKRFEKVGTILQFNELIEDGQMDLVNCRLALEDGLEIQSHDDGEVIIAYSQEISGEVLIRKVFSDHNVSLNLIDTIKLKPSLIFEINERSEILKIYSDFNELIRSKGW